VQRALIERIAAVDDERRQTATQMHRAIKTYKGEVIDQTRRQRRLILLIGLMMLLMIAMLGSLQLRTQAELGRLADALAQLQQKAADSAPDENPAAVASVQPASSREPRMARAEAPISLTDDPLEAETGNVPDTEANDSASLPAASPLPPATPADDASGDTSGEAMAALDALIDRRWREVQREYQRLAVDVAAPARRSRDADADETEHEQSALLVEPSSAAEPIAIAERPFGLQLIGVFERARLEDFIASRSLPDRVYVREETFRGRPWFVLFHSLHADRAPAREAMQELASDLAALKPWIRELPADAELERVSTVAVQP
jgi:DamX protein